MMRAGPVLLRRLLPIFLIAVSLLCAVSLQRTARAADAKTDDEKKKEEEEKKEKVFRASAWCAFRNLSDDEKQKKDDIESEETRVNAPRWHGYGRRGMWTSIVLEMKNTTEKTEFRGAASITVQPLTGDSDSTTRYETTYAQPFDLGPKTQKQYRFSVLCPEDGWYSAPFVVSGNYSGYPFQRSIMIEDLDAQAADFILVISETAGGFRYLHNEPRGTLAETEGIRQRRVASVEPAELPTRWHDLMAANLIILDGPPREALTDAQWEALRAYVEAGGHLLITAGKDPSRLKGPVEELCGITVGEMAEVKSLDGDFAFSASPQQQDWRLPIVNVTVSPKGTPLVSRNKASQLVESVRRNLGSGSVNFLAYSLSDPALHDWSGRLSIPIALIQNERGRRLFTADMEDVTTRASQRQQQYRGYQGYNTIEPDETLPNDSLTGFRSLLDTSFAKDTPVRSHPKGLVLAFLLFYLLAAVPVSYFVFGWLGRRELAWIFAPLVSALFCGIGYYVGHHGQVGDLTVNELSVIEAGPGMPHGMGRTFAAIYAPNRDDYTIHFPAVPGPDGTQLDTLAAPNHLLNVLNLKNREIDAPTMRLNDLGNAFEIDGLRIQYRSTRHLEILHRAGLGEGLQAGIQKDSQNHLHLEVENDTGAVLLFPTYVLDGRALPLTQPGRQTLSPGEKLTLDDVKPGSSDWQGIDEAFFGKRTVFASARGPHISPRVNLLAAYMRANIDKFRDGAIFCWLDRATPALPMDISTSWGNQINARFEPITLLVVPLTQRRSLNVATLSKSKLKALKARQFAPQPENVTWGPLSERNEMVTWTRSLNAGEPGTTNKRVLFVKLDLPPNHRELSELGYSCTLDMTLQCGITQGVLRQKINGAPGDRAMTLDGSLHTDVLIREGAGDNGRWEELGDELFGGPTGLQVHVSPKAKTVELPIGNYRATRDQCIILRISFEPLDPNAVQYDLKLQNLRHTLLEPQ
jgi:hypothetical protein